MSASRSPPPSLLILSLERDTVWSDTRGRTHSNQVHLNNKKGYSNFSARWNWMSGLWFIPFCTHRRIKVLVKEIDVLGSCMHWIQMQRLRIFHINLMTFIVDVVGLGLPTENWNCIRLVKADNADMSELWPFDIKSNINRFYVNLFLLFLTEYPLCKSLDFALMWDC